MNPNEKRKYAQDKFAGGCGSVKLLCFPDNDEQNECVSGMENNQGKDIVVEKVFVVGEGERCKIIFSS